VAVTVAVRAPRVPMEHRADSAYTERCAPPMKSTMTPSRSSAPELERSHVGLDLTVGDEHHQRSVRLATLQRPRRDDIDGRCALVSAVALGRGKGRGVRDALGDPFPAVLEAPPPWVSG
jgi:hypothetical protein